MSSSLIKVLKIIATVVGIGATLLGNFVEEKKTEATIQEKVDEALAKKNQ